MKKAIGISLAVIGIVFLTSMILHRSTAQSSQKDSTVNNTISSEVMKIAERSCLKCHEDGGNKMALMHLNLSNWDKFSPEKKADKAKEMCKMVTKDKMPPKSFREENPGAAPNQEETKIICDWAESIQIPKK